MNPRFDFKQNLNKLVYDLSSTEYHSTGGTYSSSQLKDLIDDPEVFYRKYVSKSLEKEHISAFDIGTQVHTLILEPEKYHDECCVFKGVRRGAAWEKFQAEAKEKGKCIVTESEFELVKKLVEAVQGSPIAMGRIKRSSPEVSIFVEIRVAKGEIYAVATGKRLGKDGWVDSKVPAKGVDLILKARADGLGENFILDVKTTSGNTKSSESMRSKIAKYNYELSAALYMDLFSVAGTVMDEFIWIFASKDFYNSRSYRASDANIRVGRVLWSRAVLALAHGIETSWEFEDSLGTLEPEFWRLEYLKPRVEDLL